jgi:hypothetical protein
MVGEASDERRRRGRGGTPAVTQTTTRLEVVEVNASPRKLF